MENSQIQRGDKVTFKGENAVVLFSFWNGTKNAPFPWALIALPGAKFICAPLADMMHQ